MGESNKVTSIVLNYNRPENMKRVIDGIRSQTINSDIWIWDNSGKLEDIEGCVIIRSQKNFHCLPRLMLMGAVQTDYIWTQDDDRVLTDKELFKRMMYVSEDVGLPIVAYGKLFSHEDTGKKYPEKYWDNAYYTDHDTCNGYWNVGYKDGRVNVGSTGIMFLNRWCVDNLRLNPYLELTKEEYKYGDDMWLSEKFGGCFVYKPLFDGIKVIPDNGVGLCHDKEHYPIRNELCRRYWLEK